MQRLSIPFFRALLISALLLLLILFVWFFLTFNFSGGETFDEIRKRALALVTGLGFFLGIAALRIKRHLKRGEKGVAIGIGILPTIAFIIALGYYTQYLNHHIHFDRKTWGASRIKPFDMTVSLIKEHQLIGLSKSDVKDLLGPALENEVENTGYHAITYFVGGSWILTICFDNNKVVETELRKTWLSI